MRIAMSLLAALAVTLVGCGGRDPSPVGGPGSTGLDRLSGARLASAYATNRQTWSAQRHGRWGTSAGPVPGICGDARLTGFTVAEIDGPSACGVPVAVELSTVSGIAVRGPAKVSCAFARTFADWVEGGLKPVARDQGLVVTEMRSVAGYACRSRNSRRGARLSNHAFGNALDISAFTFADGSVAALPGDWGGGRDGRFLSAVQTSACAAFNTVLGPEYNAAHRDHFHFDISPNFSSSAFCR
ncbi:MAG: extensin family protein [Pseudomonadota bacterium]